MSPTAARTRLSWVTVAAAAVTLALTGVLSGLSYVINQRNEHRLLNLQVRQTATVLQAIVPVVQTPIASAAEIAVADRGSPRSFRSYMSAYVGTSPKAEFAGASLWQVRNKAAHQVAMIGRPPVLTARQIDSTMVKAAATPNSLWPIGPLGLSQPRARLGYAYAAGGYVVYAESLLPPHRREPIKPGSPFANLRFALYLGRSVSSSTLLDTNVSSLPVKGYTAKVSVRFGASNMTLVAGTNQQLGGGLLGALWWIVIIIGLAFAALIVVTAEWLVRRRRHAEGVVARTELQLTEQTIMSRTLQQALLPEALPSPPGLRAEARYVAGGEGVDIGGDWYDLIELGDRRVFLVIGDVSGRGVPAATTMAMLRFAVRAFASEGHPPATVLDRLATMIDITRGGQFATMLCGVIDVDRHQIELANAGHLPPLVIDDGDSRYLEVPVGPPIGVAVRPSYEAVTVPVPRRATLLAFTDGLVERLDEPIDESLERLRSEIGPAAPLGAILDSLVPEAKIGRTDDVAILGVQWLQ